MRAARSVACLASLFIASGCTEYSVKGFEDGVGGLDSEAVGEDSGGEGGGDDSGPDPDVIYEGSVTGRVCDPSGGLWIVGATVTLSADLDGDGVADVVITTTTDADGYYTLTGVPDGTWTVRVEKGSFWTEFEVTVAGGNTETAEAECLTAEDVKIAVVTGAYDSIEVVLDKLGMEYDLIQGEFGNQATTFLKDSARMAEYDIIFLNCGIAENWIGDKATIAANIAAYTKDGGSVYTSDWAYYFFEAAYPNALDFQGEDKTYGSAYLGMAGKIKATVLDADMQAVIGSSTADLNYDLDAWAVVTSASASATVLIEGDARLWGATVKKSPLAAEIRPGGRMIYTSFHNEQQSTVHMDLLLMEIILSL